MLFASVPARESAVRPACVARCALAGPASPLPLRLRSISTPCRTSPGVLSH